MIRLLPIIILISLLPDFAAAAPSSNDSYLLRPGDVLNVNVWNHLDFSDPAVKIRPDGMIMLPFIGELKAAGLTPVQLTNQVKARLEKELKKPVVTISVVSFKQDFIFVAGAVQKPGPIAIVDPLTVQQTIASAGGLLPIADINHASIISAEGIRTEINLSEELNSLETIQHTRLTANTTLFIPEAQRSIAVLGAVNKPGAFPLPTPGMRVSEAIAMAGGYTPDADYAHARLTRNGIKSVDFNALTIVNDVNSVDNISLNVGDVIFIPSAINQTYAILGEVNKPGINPLTRERPTRITDALATAEGLTSLADIHAVRLMRNGKDPITLDLDSLLKGDKENDIELNTGDSLYIPRMAFYTIIGQVVNPGRYPLQGETRTIDAIAAAEGIMGTARGVSGYLIHQDGKTEDIDLIALLDKKNLVQNLQIRDGDTLVVNSMSIGVVVVGAVRTPGRIITRAGSRFSEVIAICGDFLINADYENCRILRNDAPDLLINGKQAFEAFRTDATNPIVNDGDTIIVDFAVTNVTVLGEVVLPGVYELRKNPKVTDAIARAGGLRNESRRGTIYHIDGTITNIDIYAASNINERNSNVILKENDTLFLHPYLVGQATIIGNINKQGSYQINENTRLSELIGMGEGLQLDVNPLEATIVSRSGESRIIDITSVLEDIESANNVRINDGDVVTIQAPKPVVVVGSVRYPGIVRYRSDLKLSAALAGVSGLLDRVEPGDAKVLRLDGTNLDVDLPALFKGDASCDVALLPGDVVIVTENKPMRISVLGAVKRPGVLAMPSEQRLSSALAETEGLLEIADIRKIKLVRQSQQRIFDFTPYLRSEAVTEDPLLEDGDLVIVPEMNARATILGMVANPGIYDILPEDNVLTLLGKAKGATVDGAINRVILIRQINEKEATYAELDLSRALNTADVEKINMALKDGDILYVPEKSRRNLMQFFRDLLPVTSFIRVFQ